MKSKEQISYNMRRVRNKDSQIEITLRRELWAQGLRYRKNVKSVYGHPDIAFIGKKVAVFCDSEFWHGFNWSERKHDFRSNQDFWIPKIERNMQRDADVTQHLRQEGWTVLRFWGKEIKNDVSVCANKIMKAVNGNEQV